MAVKIFYSYAYEDKGHRETLEKHLSTLKQSALITEWSDRNINAGKEWAKAIDSNLQGNIGVGSLHKRKLIG